MGTLTHEVSIMEHSKETFLLDPRDWLMRDKSFLRLIGGGWSAAANCKLGDRVSVRVTSAPFQIFKGGDQPEVATMTTWITLPITQEVIDFWNKEET